ncbi:MAG: hypothetical protein OJF49_004833 [Ktedonobacterales bacterium]|nr:MAG: hypothetical protein OJF49_004833 [Ktedonobacterales bacterium]
MCGAEDIPLVVETATKVAPTTKYRRRVELLGGAAERPALPLRSRKQCNSPIPHGHLARCHAATLSYH